MSEINFENILTTPLSTRAEIEKWVNPFGDLDLDLIVAIPLWSLMEAEGEEAAKTLVENHVIDENSDYELNNWLLTLAGSLGDKVFIRVTGDVLGY